MCLASFIPEIIESGVASLKIEGRMKGAEYVYGVISIYRRLLDERRAATREELSGLAAIFSDSETLYGVNRSENKWMKGYVEKNTGDITEAKVQLAIDKLEEYSGSKVNFIICSWGVRRALAQALSKYKTMDSVELDGGFRALSFNGIPVVADRFCPAGTMYLLNTDDFSLHQLCDWQWLESEDGSILKQKTNKAAFAATLVKYAELICSRPCGQGMLSGIVEA
jgi:hypothetical protein